MNNNLFQLTLPPSINDNVRLTPGQLIFEASRKLTQFNVIDFTFVQERNNSVIKLNLYLKRILSYHVTNTFIPTTSLLFIAELTLFFDDLQTELAIG
jgi:hypothetical protein